MSRGLITILVAVVLAVGALLWLAWRAREVPTTRIEQVVRPDAPAR